MPAMVSGIYKQGKIELLEIPEGLREGRVRVMLIEDNVLYLEKDEVTCYVNIDKIIAVWDSREKKANPPGFVIRAD